MILHGRKSWSPVKQWNVWAGCLVQRQICVNKLTQAIFSKCQNSLCLLICICITVLSASLMLSRVFSIRGNKSMIFCLLIRILLLGGVQTGQMSAHGVSSCKHEWRMEAKSLKWTEKTKTLSVFGENWTLTWGGCRDLWGPCLGSAPSEWWPSPSRSCHCSHLVQVLREKHQINEWTHTSV